jgi:undecaprenyl-diphosphatase
MSGWEAIVLGIVEGVTEFLPVSSTGHLLVAQRLLGIARSEASDAYAICIQSGAILAVLSLYWRRIVQMLRGMTAKFGWGDDAGSVGFRLALNIVVAFLPAAVLGVLLDDWVEQRLFGLWPIVAAWFVGGIAILVVARLRRSNSGDLSGMELERLTSSSALAIGLIQCIAMWPGTSRSLVTIVGGVLVGLNLAAAVEFSFLLGVVTLLAATAYKLREAGPVMVEHYGGAVMFLGLLSAWLSAIVAVRWMVTYLKRHGLELFGYYRIAIALVVAWGIWRGWFGS